MRFFEEKVRRGQAGGYAGLDGSGLLPLVNVPTGIPAASISGTAVVQARTVAGHALSSDVTIVPGDVGAAPATGIAASAITGTAVVTTDIRLRQAARNAALGILGESYPFCNSVQVQPTSQWLWAAGIPLLAGDVVNNVIVGVGTPGAGTNPTLIKVGLWSIAANGSAVTLRASTANLNTDARWNSAGWKACAMTDPGAYTIPSTGMYYPAFLINGVHGTTPMKLITAALAISSLSTIYPSQVIPMSFALSGQTDFASPINSPANASGLFMYFAVN